MIAPFVGLGSTQLVFSRRTARPALNAIRGSVIAVWGPRICSSEVTTANEMLPQRELQDGERDAYARRLHHVKGAYLAEFGQG